MDTTIHSNDLDYPVRSFHGMGIQIVRMEHAKNGMCFHSDVRDFDHAVEKVVALRTILDSFNVYMDGPVKLKSVETLKGSQKLKFNSERSNSESVNASTVITLSERVESSESEEQIVYKASVDAIKDHFRNKQGRINWLAMAIQYAVLMGSLGINVSINTLDTIKRYSNYKLTDAQFRPSFKMFVDATLETITVKPSEDITTVETGVILTDDQHEFTQLVDRLKRLYTIGGKMRWDIVSTRYAKFTGGNLLTPHTVKRYAGYRTTDINFQHNYRDFMVGEVTAT